VSGYLRYVFSYLIKSILRSGHYTLYILSRDAIIFPINDYYSLRNALKTNADFKLRVTYIYLKVFKYVYK
jgi:hypothetical protein